MDEWNDRTLEQLDTTMNLGHVIVIRDTKINEGWDFNMRNASRIRSGPNKVEVQGKPHERTQLTLAQSHLDFCNRHRPTGVENVKVPLVTVVHPDFRDPEKVFNMLDAPQSTPLIHIPRQKCAIVTSRMLTFTDHSNSDLDYGSMAVKARMESFLASELTTQERELDFNIQKGLNWAIISQKFSMTMGHVDTAGVYTAIGILTGDKYWAILKTALTGQTEIDVDNIEYFVELGDRDIESLPGGSKAWIALVLRAGDILCVT